MMIVERETAVGPFAIFAKYFGLRRDETEIERACARHHLESRARLDGAGEPLPC